MAERYCQGKTEVLGDELVAVPHCPPQIPHGLASVRTPRSSVQSWVNDCLRLGTVLF